VDVSFVDNTGTPRFLIVWSLVKEGGQWKLDEQLSAQRINDGYSAAPSSPQHSPPALRRTVPSLS
jgi:hypothetical protein